MWFCAVPWGPVMVATGHMFFYQPREDFCVTERSVQCSVWARNHFSECLIEQILKPVWVCAAPWGSVMLPTVHMIFYQLKETFCFTEKWAQCLVWARTHIGEGLIEHYHNQCVCVLPPLG